MPALENGRHEQFAQAFVAGPTAGNATASYKLVYGKENRSAASRLQHNRNILNRVAELQNRAEEVEAKAAERLVEKVVATKEWIVDRLVENAQRAMQAQPVIVEGEATGEFKYDGNVANRALELLGKHLGMFVERRHVTSEFDGLTEDEIDRRISELRGELGDDSRGEAQVPRASSPTGEETPPRTH